MTRTGWALAAAVILIGVAAVGVLASSDGGPATGTAQAAASTAAVEEGRLSAAVS